MFAFKLPPAAGLCQTEAASLVPQNSLELADCQLACLQSAGSRMGQWLLGLSGGCRKLLHGAGLQQASLPGPQDQGVEAAPTLPVWTVGAGGPCGDQSQHPLPEEETEAPRAEEAPPRSDTTSNRLGIKPCFPSSVWCGALHGSVWLPFFPSTPHS